MGGKIVSCLFAEKNQLNIPGIPTSPTNPGGPGGPSFPVSPENRLEIQLG